MTLNFSDMPGFQNLFLDYLNEFENVEKFYIKNFRNQEDYGSLFETLSNRERPHRRDLAAIIREQYRGFKTSKQTRENIEAIKATNTVAIVTGQQLGLLGGPLYTLFKTITTIKLCNRLKEQYDNYNFIPVFWMEGDDHDFEEVRETSILDRENEVMNIRYDDGKEEEENRGSTAEIKFNDGINKVFEELDEVFYDNDFKDELFTFLKEAYSEGDTMESSFRKLMFGLFDEYGLILFNPHDPAVKRMLIPVFRKEINNYGEHTDRLVERSAELEEVYHAQVKVRPINLFMEKDGGRYTIEPDEETYRLRGKRVKFTKEELLQELNDHPEEFSPNVLLRPICQDFLFPTAFYIGGPAEISYFAQVIPLYGFFNIPQPYLYPRASATIIEKNLHKVFDKYDMEISDFFIEEKLLNKQVVDTVADFDMGELFGEAEEEVDKIIDKLKEYLYSVDKNLMNVADKTRDRMKGGLSGLRDKAFKAEEKVHDITLRQINRARNNIYPENTLQERVLNFSYFAHKHGLDVVKLIFNELSVSRFEHQVIEL